MGGLQHNCVNAIVLNRLIGLGILAAIRTPNLLALDQNKCCTLIADSV